MVKSTGKPGGSKHAARPPKPYPEFPLSPANNGYWQKKVRGKVLYYLRWGQVRSGKMEVLPAGGAWKEALEFYQKVIDDDQAGRKRRLGKPEGLTIGGLRDRFLTLKSRALDAGEITAPTYLEYKKTVARLVSVFGERRLVEDLASDDFETLRANITERWGPVRLANEVQRVRSIFKYAYDSGLIDRPVRFGAGFKKPSAKVLCQQRAKNGARMIEAEEIQTLLKSAPVQAKAWVLLCVNAAFTNKDIGDLPCSALDLKGGWVDSPRPKTAIRRRAKLWPETVKAIRDWLAVRPEPQDGCEDLVFLTETGNTWISSGTANAIARTFRDLLKTLKIHRHRIGLGALRHTFRTVADRTNDRPAIDLIMGHSDPSMVAHYRERIEAHRLAAVSDHIRAWLFGSKPQQ
ncbi:MAG: site-specific integrase [Rhodopirellula sp.]|nr:site-specific integrase [Rhodopirellula sp.]